MNIKKWLLLFSFSILDSGQIATSIKMFAYLGQWALDGSCASFAYIYAKFTKWYWCISNIVQNICILFLFYFDVAYFPGCLPERWNLCVN